MKRTGRQLFGAAAAAIWLAIGAGAIWGVLCVWVGALAGQFWEHDPWHRLVVIRSDGTPLIESHSRRNWLNVHWTTLDGTTVIPPSDAVVEMPRARGAGLIAPRTAGAAFARLPWITRLVSTSDMRRPSAVWYLVHDGYPDGHGYFVGYDTESRECVGYLGLAGLRDDRPPVEEQFAIRGGLMRSRAVFESYATIDGGRNRTVLGDDFSPQGTPPWVQHFIAGGRVFRFDPRKHTATPFLDTQDAVSLSLLQRTTPWGQKLPPGATPPNTLLAVRTPDRILLVDRDTSKTQAFQLPEELKEAAFGAYLVADDELMLTQERLVEGNFDVSMHWIGTDGKIRRRQQCRVAEGGWTATPSAFAAAACAVAPAPIVGHCAAVIGPAMGKLDTGQAATWSEAVGQVLPQAWPPVAVLTLVSAGLAWRCYRRQVRYALPGTAWWVVMVLLGGLPGYLGYRFHRPWAPLRACPACGRQSPRDRESCAACGQQFPTPAKLGNEVFAA